MIITVTSPRRGMGQTITAINTAAVLSGLGTGRCLIIDTNSSFNDAEDYLGSAQVTRGLDDFYNLYETKLLSAVTFGRCVEIIHKNIEFMAANNCFRITSNHIQTLIKYVKTFYEYTVIDMDGYKNEEKSIFLESSDIILVVINQMKNVINCISNDFYILKKYRNKIVFILNRYQKEENGRNSAYDLDDVERDLKNMGLRNEIFVLDYDLQLINECNRHSVLNYTLNTCNNKSSYRMQLNSIVNYIINDFNPEQLAKPQKNRTVSRLFERYRMILDTVWKG